MILRQKFTNRMCTVCVCYYSLFLFVCFRKLKRLNLGGNGLTSVPWKALTILDMLKKLEMQENRISEIKEGDFEGKYCKSFISSEVRNINLINICAGLEPKTNQIKMGSIRLKTPQWHLLR